MTSDYKCARCGREIEEGDFIAVLGEAPPSGLLTPIGRADKIIKEMGSVYCKDCLPEIIEKK